MFVIRIMSRQQQNRFRIVFKIERHNFLIDIICDRYCFFDRFCVAMKNSSSRFKCSKCIRVDKVCVNIF